MSKIIETLKTQTMQAKLKKYGIKHLWLFWSYAVWNNTKDSDIDLLYDYSDAHPSTFEWWWLFSALPFLEEQLWRKVDLVNIKYIDPLIEKDILWSKKQIF